MFYANSRGKKIEATPRSEGYCPLCKKRLIPKCGQILVWHWAHRAGADCCSWSEPESEWHLGWKRLFPPECCEVVMGPHRADILTPQGIVVELQSRSISPEVAREREEFYGNMIWLFRADEFADNLQISFDTDSAPYGRVSFRWEPPRTTHTRLRKPLFWDLGDGELLEVTGLSRSGHRGHGHLQPREGFAKRLLQSHARFVPSWLQGREIFKGETLQTDDLPTSPPSFGEGVSTRRMGTKKPIAGQGLLF